MRPAADCVGMSSYEPRRYRDPRVLDHRKLDPRRLAAAKLAARREKVRRIRNRTAVGSAAAFVAVFGGLYGQLVSGHDPALAKTAKPSSGKGSKSTTAQSQAATSTDPQSSTDPGPSLDPGSYPDTSSTDPQYPSDTQAPVDPQTSDGTQSAPSSSYDQTWSAPAPAPVQTSQS